MSKKGPTDQLQALADKLRSRKGVEGNSAKLTFQNGGYRVDFIRGKDFARYFRKHPELADFVDSGGQKTPEERIAEVGVLLLKKGLLRRTERKYKKPKPGKPRLVKWPKTLEAVSSEEAHKWDELSFYAWQYDKPASAWLYFWSFLMVIAVIACCLLPIAPYKVKIVVFYASVSLLSVIGGILFVRTSVWLSVWMLTGRELWLLPNILSDEVGLQDAFVPLISFEIAKGLKSHWIVRAAALAVIGALVWFLNKHKPGSEEFKEGFQKAHDDILDFLSLHDPGRKKLGKSAESDPFTQDQDTGNATKDEL